MFTNSSSLENAKSASSSSVCNSVKTPPRRGGFECVKEKIGTSSHHFYYLCYCFFHTRPISYKRDYYGLRELNHR